MHLRQHLYPEDKKFQLGNSWLLSDRDKPLLMGSQSVLVDGFGSVETSWQPGDFSSQLTQGLPNYNGAYQSLDITNVSALNPLYQPNQTGYGEAIQNTSTSKVVNSAANLSREITAQREYTFDGNSMPSVQSFVDNWGRSVPISSLLETIFSSTNHFNPMQNQIAKMEMSLIPANDKQDNYTTISGLSTGTFQTLNKHDENFNQLLIMDNTTCDTNLIDNVPVTLNESSKHDKFQLYSMTERTIEEQNYIKSIEDDPVIDQGCEVLQNIVDSSTAASGNAMDIGKISDQGIDLNKTPLKKPPKRRKHRPKVVIEGKAKRKPRTTTKESATSGKKPSKKSATSDEKPPGKRKYVRRKGLSETDQKAAGMKKTADSSTGGGTTPCKRKLEFGLAKSKDVNQQEIQQSNRSFDLNSISGYTGLYSRFDGVGNMESNTKLSERNGFEEVNELESAYTTVSFPVTDRILHTESMSFTNRYLETRKDQTVSQDVLSEAGCNRQYCRTSTTSEDSQKKRKTENSILTKMSAPHSNLLQSEDDTVHSGKNNSCSPSLQTIQSIVNSQSISGSPNRLNNGVNRYLDNESLSNHVSAVSSFSRQHNSSPMGETKKLAQVNSSMHQKDVNKYKLNLPTPTKITSTVKGKTSKRRPAKRSPKSKKADTTSLTSNVPDAPQENCSPSDNIHSFQNTRGKAEARVYPYIDEVIKLFNSLNIRVISDQDQNALVPYSGSGAIIPIETKKKRPRPKVDLDTETVRVWNLLMGIEGSKDADTMHKGSESWWENERNVFRGRADSFIARMRLVQGDRHFSRWKGSVVDSVIGVFLTQNVSDHLSSSAFMTLAAAFPLKTRRNSEEIPQDSAGILVEEPETCALDPEEPLRHENVSYRITEISATECQIFQEEIISSQDSFGTSVIQGTEAIRSYSGSNSEAEDPCPPSAYHRTYDSTLTDVHSVEKTTPFEDNLNCITWCSLSDQRFSHGQTTPEKFEHEQKTAYLHTSNCDNQLEQSPAVHVDNYQVNSTEIGILQGVGEESSSSWPSAISGISHAKEVGCTSRMTGQTESSNNCKVQNQGRPISEEKPPTRHNALTENHLVNQQSTNTKKSKTANCQQHDINSELESTKGMKKVNLAHNISELIEDTFEVEASNLTAQKQRKLESIVDAPISKEQSHPSDAASIDNNNSTNKRKKGKAGGEIKPEEYWESLRKQVQAESTNKERSYDAMDSMDYEAVRHASVNYISEVIKERGMNNRLAERMKEFLNRTVRVHGSIDLEWLRDVPPEEAKDYLLNIWGIGLKSVECVRLLTLHHLAFPVDTNVGRIAVRLGWVPLQPLPESLQLHLLDLYPILETIQKYLWPRLCKLDQQTLYELHYHLITFGKVFCTKHKPNCNACPLRGECRHFASAFASARLALPGPEEKNIVPSCPLIASAGDMPLVANTVPQLTAESSSCIGTCSMESKCQPIIEEPKSPEPEFREVLEYDIEDTFWEDSDEIPTFRLNMQEFTVNLQNYMQQANMELQESDVSKALVALTPEAASIPAAKLKNVNRLRTEHQVYELPDLHPLLKGMDRREPDDPSPYLLAIWAPGETANTVQPPEIKCGSQETGQLCTEKTCFTCNTIRESDSQTVRGTLLIPCRTAIRGRFPLNGTYFQVNEVFADDKTSKNPIAVPRQWLWSLSKRTVYFGTSVTSIFRGLTTEQIQLNFWRGFVCVRGFDKETRAPRPLVARLHYSQAMLARDKFEKSKDGTPDSKANQILGSNRSSSNKEKKLSA